VATIGCASALPWIPMRGAPYYPKAQRFSPSADVTSAEYDSNRARARRRRCLPATRNSRPLAVPRTDVLAVRCHRWARLSLLPSPLAGLDRV